MSQLGEATVTRRGKNIVVCSDGTGNRDIEGRGTNVFSSYYVYLAACVAVLVAASAPEGARTTPGAFVRNLGTLVYNIATLQVGALLDTARQLLVSRSLLALLASGFVLSWMLERVADSRMSREFGRFWHDRQPQLREALKGARKGAAKAFGSGNAWPPTGDTESVAPDGSRADGAP